MVHGGGHHNISHHGGGHHTGGGGFSGDGVWNRNRGWNTGNEWWAHNTNNVVVVNNNPNSNYGWNSYQRDMTPNNRFGNGECESSYRGNVTPTNRSGDEECERCCRRYCLCCAACAAVESVRGRPQMCHSLCHFITLSTIMLLVLLAISNVADEWTLNAGETRQVLTRPWLNNEVSISTSIPDSVSIYSLNGACPPLTGPTVTFGETQDITLSEGDYQYDYFYLNTGSFLDVTLTQDYGATNVFIMRGLDAVHQRSGENSFTSSALMTRYAGAGQTAYVRYSVPASDTYAVIYDNASNFNGHSTVTYEVVLTTFSLDDVTPVSGCEGSTKCSVENSAHACILVKAADEVTVHVSASRRWGAILFYCAVIPVVIGIICRPRRNDEVDIVLPPATAPDSYANATVEPLVDIPVAVAYPVASAIPEVSPLPSAPYDDKV